jgi:hypothetical protein
MRLTRETKGRIRTGKDLLKGGFAKVSSLGKVRRVIESENIKLMERVEGSSSGQGAIRYFCKELFGAAYRASSTACVRVYGRRTEVSI